MGTRFKLWRFFSTIASFFIKIIAFLSSHASLLVALATFSLAALTFGHITVTKRMAEETKRLADENIEQFKIKSYPTFLVEIKKVKLESEPPFQKFKIVNKGEITAHNVTFLPILIYQSNHRPHFQPIVGTYYESQQRMTAVNFETKIWQQSAKTLVSEIRFSNRYNLDNLKNVLLFIKFKVPYDTKYRYDVFGYILKKELEKEKESLYRWQEISTTDCTNIIQKFLNLSSNWDQYMKSFFVDYPVDKPTLTKKLYRLR